MENWYKSQILMRFDNFLKVVKKGKAEFGNGTFHTDTGKGSDPLRV